MSFPPRPPMGMPPMGPGMMPQGYAFAPMGMMPMGMGMMPAGPMMPQPMTVVPSGPNQPLNTVKPSKKLIPQEIKDDSEEKPPVTTVFVGNISERAPDAMIRTMLQRCGNVLSWKRVQGASGKLQAFGFCEYEDPEATLRCIRLLNEWAIADKKLVVKVDAKTKTLLDDYRAKKSKKENGDKPKRPDMEEGEEEPPPPLSADLDEFSQREDRVAKAGLDAIMREYSHELNKVPPQEPKENKPREKKKEDLIKDAGLDDMGLEDDKKEIINREIKSFRDAHKDEDDPEQEDRERYRDRDRDRIKRDRRDRERERIRERDYREREERERHRERKDRGRDRSYERSRTRSRSRSRERHSRIRSRDRSRERPVSRDRDRKDREKELEEEEEAYERRKLEKRLREKEAAYRERLKNWEIRENKKSREYKKEKDREVERKEEEVREGRRLKEFLEDYDDERDDPKYYKGSALGRRLKEREKEKEVDDRDRQREREELDDIRRRLLEEGHPDPESEIAKIEREREEHLKPKQVLIEPEPPAPEPVVEKEVAPPAPPPERSPDDDRASRLPKMAPTLKPVEAPVNGDSSSMASDEDSRFSFSTAQSLPEEPSAPVYGPAPKQEAAIAKKGFSGIKLGASESPTDSNNKRKKFTVGDVFNQDDEEAGDAAKKRKLIPLDYEDTSEKKPSTAEEKRQHIKKLIERIPTAKDELFTYELDWTMVDRSLMDKRIKPWVNKKIVEYIGEEEPTLTDFICQKVMAQSSPENILNDVAMVLDEEAEVFVVKMWRLLIYETEAKKAGLVK
ncbi:RNA-binding protein 25-like isoform X2 [Liolophura sinensis]|uniref:RNA-binding protein 25-like isoform X2 n=1 Tax=Liolophura sinensis TaxID=3198878 RepID=UPI003158755B